jgi:hypothetical protein
MPDSKSAIGCSVDEEHLPSFYRRQRAQLLRLSISFGEALADAVGTGQ